MKFEDIKVGAIYTHISTGFSGTCRYKTQVLEGAVVVERVGLDGRAHFKFKPAELTEHDPNKDGKALYERFAAASRTQQPFYNLKSWEAQWPRHDVWQRFAESIGFKG